MLMVNVYPEQAEHTGKIPDRHQQARPLREWRFIELLRVVKATGWLPSGLELDTGEWRRGRAQIGDYAEVVRSGSKSCASGEVHD